MNTSLINISFHSSEPLVENSLDSEIESEASNYIAYLDNFNNNFNNLLNRNPERSESLLRPEGSFREDEILNFDEDSNQEHPVLTNENLTPHSEMSFSIEARREMSILNKNVSLINLNVIPEEQDVSFTFNRNFLSFLNDEKPSGNEDALDVSDGDDLGNLERFGKLLRHKNMPEIKRKVCRNDKDEVEYNRGLLENKGNEFSSKKNIDNDNFEYFLDGKIGLEDDFDERDCIRYSDISNHNKRQVVGNQLHEFIFQGNESANFLVKSPKIKGQYINNPNECVNTMCKLANYAQNHVNCKRGFCDFNFELKSSQIPQMNLEVIVKQSGQDDRFYNIDSNFGVLGSRKNIVCQDVIIGRASFTGSLVPNDIVLETDNSVSRIHLRFITKYFFNKSTKSNLNFMSLIFFMKKKRKAFSKFLFSQILGFLKKPAKIYLQDLGSSIGTFLRLSSKTGFALQPDMEFKLGDEACFRVIPLQMFANSINLLKKQPAINFVNTSFYGFKNVEDEILKTNFEKKQFLILQTKSCPSSVSEFLVFNPIFENNYVIGRISGCDVCVNLASVSRKQAVLIFDDQKWILRDGFNGKPSKNGCWTNVGRRRGKKAFSKKVEVDFNDEIMVGNFLLTIRSKKNEI